MSVSTQSNQGHDKKLSMADLRKQISIGAFWSLGVSAIVTVMGLVLVNNGMNIALTVVVCAALAFFFSYILIPGLVPEGLSLAQASQIYTWSPVVMLLGMLYALLKIMSLMFLAMAFMSPFSEVCVGPVLFRDKRVK